MITIGDRMELMSSMISLGETVGDIGTDHGLLPLKLWISKTSPKVIMSDMSKPSLEKAKENFKIALSKDSELEKSSIDFRLGDGLEVYENGEVDAITIAGMGGRLIVKILSENTEKTRSISKFVLQPRNGSHILRQYLINNDFEIIEEALVIEGKYICEIMCVKPNDKVGEKSDGNFKYRIEKKLDKKDVRWELPIAEKLKNEELFLELLRRKLKKKEEILLEIKSNKSELSMRNTEKINHEINQLKGVINEI